MEGFKDRVVRLNVGGVKYMTHLSTLTGGGTQDNFFAALFSERHKVERDDDGYVFIDRNGKNFDAILDFLRTGTFEVPPHCSESRLMEDVEYYGLLTFGSLAPAYPVAPLSDADVVELMTSRKHAEYAANAAQLDPIRDIIFATFRDAVAAGNPMSVTVVPSRDRLREVAAVDTATSYSDRLEYSLVGPDSEKPRTALVRDDSAIATLEVPGNVNALIFSLAHVHALSIAVDEYVLYLKRNASGVFWLTDIRAGAWSVHLRYYVISWTGQSAGSLPPQPSTAAGASSSARR